MLSGDRTKNSRLLESFPLFQLEEYDFFYANAPVPIGLKSTYPSSLKKKIAASFITEYMDFQSVDNVLKRHLSEFEYPEVSERRLDLKIRRYVDTSMAFFTMTIKEISFFPGKEFGDIVGEWTLSRASFSMKIFAHSAQLGALFEAVAVVRMMLEQLAWASAVRSLDENLSVKLKPQACLRELRILIPSAGPLYGWLSKHAHWMIDGHKKSMISKGDDVGHLYTSVYFKALLFQVMLLMTGFYMKVLRVIITSFDANKKRELSRKITKVLARSRSLMRQILSIDPEDPDMRELAAMMS